MTRVVYGLTLVVAFLAGGLLMNGLTTKAEDPKPAAKADEPKPKGQLYAKWKELGLSKEQVEQIYKIQSEHRTKISKLEAQIKALRAEERAEAEKILTPAQKARLKELLSGEGDKDKSTKDKPEKDKTGDKTTSKDKAPEKDK